MLFIQLIKDCAILGFMQVLFIVFWLGILKTNAYRFFMHGLHMYTCTKKTQLFYADDIQCALFKPECPFCPFMRPAPLKS